jgi:hypothetical protein
LSCSLFRSDRINHIGCSGFPSAPEPGARSTCQPDRSEFLKNGIFGNFVVYWPRAHPSTSFSEHTMKKMAMLR